jgi:hypothetical protein
VLFKRCTSILLNACVCSDYCLLFFIVLLLKGTSSPLGLISLSTKCEVKDEHICFSDIRLINLAAEGCLEDVKQLTPFCTDDKGFINLVLREACTRAQWGVERWIIEHTTVDVNYTDLLTNNTVLHSVVWCNKNKGHTPLHLACMDRDGLEQVSTLIFNYDYDVNIQDNEGYTPLHWACHCGNAKIVEYLMSAGADVTYCNEEGLTAGQVARRTGHVELVKLLDKITSEKEVLLYGT